MTTTTNKYEIEKYALAHLPVHACQTVVITDEGFTHNSADYHHSLATLDAQLADFGYSRDGVSTPSVAEWAAAEIVSGTDESMIDKLMGLPASYRAGLLKTWRKFS